MQVDDVAPAAGGGAGGSGEPTEQAEGRRDADQASRMEVDEDEIEVSELKPTKPTHAGAAVTKVRKGKPLTAADARAGGTGPPVFPKKDVPPKVVEPRPAKAAAPAKHKAAAAARPAVRVENPLEDVDERAAKRKGKQKATGPPSPSPPPRAPVQARFADMDEDSEPAAAPPAAPPKKRSKVIKSKPQVESEDDEPLPVDTAPGPSRQAKEKAKKAIKSAAAAPDDDELMESGDNTSEIEERVKVTKARRSKGKATGDRFEASGKIHVTRCSNCARRSMECEANVGGGSCVGCRRGRKYCEYSSGNKPAATGSSLVDSILKALEERLEPIQNGIDEMFSVFDDVYADINRRSNRQGKLLRGVSRRLRRMEESIGVPRPPGEQDATPWTNSDIATPSASGDEDDEAQLGIRETLRLKREAVDETLTSEPRETEDLIPVVENEEMGSGSGLENMPRLGELDLNKAMEVDEDAEGSAAPPSTKGAVSPVPIAAIPVVKVISATPQSSQDVVDNASALAQRVVAASSRASLRQPDVRVAVQGQESTAPTANVNPLQAQVAHLPPIIEWGHDAGPAGVPAGAAAEDTSNNAQNVSPDADSDTDEDEDDGEDQSLTVRSTLPVPGTPATAVGPAAAPSTAPAASARQSRAAAATAANLHPVAPPGRARTRSFTRDENTAGSSNLGPETRSRSTSTASRGSATKRKGSGNQDQAGKRPRRT